MGHLLPTKGDFAVLGFSMILVILVIFALLTMNSSERFVDEKNEDFFDTVSRKLKEILG
tara:strand:- start:1650 stop:1826 length:177 start_codon:yes stop_codon:yes gene_type:complete